MTELWARSEGLGSGCQLAILIDAIPVALQLLHVEGDGRWRAVFNSRWLGTLLGFDNPEAAACNLHGSLSAVDADMLFGCQNDALANGVASCEVDVRFPGAEPRTLRATMRVNPRDDKVPELIAVWTDVTEDRVRRNRLAHADRLATLGEMAAGLAHELNQPLSVIMMLTELIIVTVEQGPVPPAEITNKVERIAAMAERAGKIIHNLRNFARHSAGCNGPVSLAEAFANTRAMVGAMIESEGIVIDADLPPDLPLVLGETTQIEQVLVNLLMNARDALVSAGRKDARIDIRATHDANSVRLEVADNGSGIDPAIQDRLFDAFFTTKGAGNGTGLGLAIARSAMTAMNGHIALCNASCGSVFVLSFQRAPNGVAVAGILSR